MKPPKRRRTKEPHLNQSGYYYVAVEEIETGKHYSMAVHRLVWEEGHQEVIPRGYVIHHKDGNKLNNELSNLQKMTRAQHRRHHKEYKKRKRVAKSNAFLKSKRTTRSRYHV